MTELPKIVKSRLRQQQEAGVSSHPEADQLAAFAEQALTPGEREQVLAHLAVCPECREVLRLSAPEVIVTSSAATRGVFDLRPDFFRWGIVAASAAVVVAAVLLVKPELEKAPTRGLETARMESTQPPQTVAAEPATSKDAIPEDGKAADQVQSTAERSKHALAKSQPLAPPPPPAAGYAASNTLGGGTANTIVAVPPVAEMKVLPPVRTDALSGVVRNEPSPAAAPPAGPETAKGGVNDYAFYRKETRTEARVAAPVVAQAAKKDEAPAAERERDQRFAADGAGVVAAEVEAAPPAAVPQFTAMRPAMAKTRSADALARTWRITEGQLEWSLDAGKSWRKVNAPGGARFLAVDSRRANVWAGGTSGVVIRSIDGGSTWVPVATGWTGDVVYLKFDDEKRGTLKTSTGEEWFTLDGGESWRKR